MTVKFAQDGCVVSIVYMRIYVKLKVCFPRWWLEVLGRNMMMNKVSVFGGCGERC